VNKFLLAPAAAVLLLLGMAWQSTASAAVNQLYLNQWCLPDGSVRVKFDWGGNDPSARQQWLDLSLYDNGWIWGTFLGSSPMPANQHSLTWDGLISGTTHFVRINQELAPGVWDPSPTYYWTTLRCPQPVPEAPAMPGNLDIDGALPDLSVPVPPGQGELGRITVSWTDNSSNENGFRIYQYCDGVVTQLVDVGANQRSYGPLQVCRPGRVGVASYNAYGQSDILWSPETHPVTPAAPTNLHIEGPMPDLSYPVPPGEGELGRITVSWTDNSSNEAGFRMYKDCEGVVTELLELDANEDSYGPLQVCRPGRVGVAAFNAYGESPILWSPRP
jgi:hypothetical protein